MMLNSTVNIESLKSTLLSLYTQCSGRHKAAGILLGKLGFGENQNWTKYSWIRLVSMAACSETGATLRQHMFTSSLDEKKIFSCDSTDQKVLWTSGPLEVVEELENTSLSMLSTPELRETKVEFSYPSQDSCGDLSPWNVPPTPASAQRLCRVPAVPQQEASEPPLNEALPLDHQSISCAARIRPNANATQILQFTLTKRATRNRTCLCCPYPALTHTALHSARLLPLKRLATLKSKLVPTSIPGSLPCAAHGISSGSSQLSPLCQP
ncbi:hypothetical protein EK904_010100 [Melospiza melodia maxima]|nr:hypothetical protein EK904_010100 [Melospiza melodia maxima]